MTNEDDVWSMPPTVASVLIRESRVLSWARISPDGTLRAVNATLARRAGITEDELQGASLYALLTEEDRERMRASLGSEDGISPEPFFANFVSTRHEVHTLRCRIFSLGEELALVGEPDVEEDQAFAEELLRLNNELSVLSRENARRARELEASGRQIEEALAELESSYWHLRKIQERIPLCMRCGKMKTGAAEWSSLVDYLRSNEIFVSHGYCPTCASEVLDEVDE